MAKLLTRTPNPIRPLSLRGTLSRDDDIRIRVIWIYVTIMPNCKCVEAVASILAGHGFALRDASVNTAHETTMWVERNF